MRRLTGLVATSRITHATPACFYSHVVDRDLESDIAGHLVGSHPLGHPQVDLALGGGLCFLLPNSSASSCRTDDVDLVAAAAKNKLTVLTTPAEFRALPEDASALGTIGLFNRDHLNYEIDRIATPAEQREPSLVDMTRKALGVLSKTVAQRNAPGLFLMVEGSRIDMAGHSNDPAGHVHDILAYQEAVVAVKSFVDGALDETPVLCCADRCDRPAMSLGSRSRHPAQNKAGMPTVMISVRRCLRRSTDFARSATTRPVRCDESASADVPGGLALARQLTDAYPIYEWLPDALHNATSSTIALAARLRTGLARSEIARLVNVGLGLSDPSDDELARLEASLGDTWKLHGLLGDMASWRAQLGWSTTGHSGVDGACARSGTS